MSSTVIPSSSILSSAPIKTPWKRQNTGNNNNTDSTVPSNGNKSYSKSPNSPYSNNTNKNKYSSSFNNKPSSSSSSSGNNNNNNTSGGKYTPYRSNGGGYYKKKDSNNATPSTTVSSTGVKDNTGTSSSSSSSTTGTTTTTVTPPVVKKMMSIGGIASTNTTIVAKVTDVEFDTLPIDMKYKLYHADVQTRLSLRKVTIDTLTGINFSIQGLIDKYTVRLGKQSGRWSCTCKDYQKLSRCERNCKHIYFVKLRILGNARILTVWSNGDIQGFVRLEKIKSNLFFGENNNKNNNTATTTLLTTTNDKDTVEPSSGNRNSAYHDYYDDDNDDNRDEPIVPGTKLDRSILSLHAEPHLANRILRAVQRHIYEYEQHGLKGNPKYLFPLLPRSSEILHAQSLGEDIPPRPFYPSVGIPETHLGAFDLPVYDSDNEKTSSSNRNNGSSTSKKTSSPNKASKKREREDDDEDDDEDAVQDDDDF